jgi:PEGA domain
VTKNSPKRRPAEDDSAPTTKSGEHTSDRLDAYQQLAREIRTGGRGEMPNGKRAEPRRHRTEPALNGSGDDRTLARTARAMRSILRLGRERADAVPGGLDLRGFHGPDESLTDDAMSATEHKPGSEGARRHPQTDTDGRRLRPADTKKGAEKTTRLAFMAAGRAGDAPSRDAAVRMPFRVIEEQPVEQVPAAPPGPQPPAGTSILRSLSSQLRAELSGTSAPRRERPRASAPAPVPPAPPAEVSTSPLPPEQSETSSPSSASPVPPSTMVWEKWSGSAKSSGTDAPLAALAGEDRGLVIVEVIPQTAADEQRTGPQTDTDEHRLGPQTDTDQHRLEDTDAHSHTDTAGRRPAPKLSPPPRVVEPSAIAKTTTRTNLPDGGRGGALASLPPVDAWAPPESPRVTASPSVDAPPQVLPVSPPPISDPLPAYAWLNDAVKTPPAPQAEPRPSARAAWLPPDALVTRRRTSPKRLIVALVVLALAGQGAYLAARRWWPAIAGPSLGTLALDSRPSGAEILIDGQRRGTTPLRLEVPAGPHLVEVRAGDVTERQQISIGAGEEIAQTLELAPAAAAPVSPATGTLSVRSDPPGATVIVAGKPRGVTPVDIADLPPGAYDVQLTSANLQQTRRIDVQAGQRASLVVTMTPPPAPANGTLSVASRIPVEIIQRGRVIGSSEDGRLTLPAGTHTLDFVNEGYGFREQRTVTVSAGRSDRVSLTMPEGYVNVNAVPWAEVIIDGRSFGQTPLGRVSLPIGTHDIVFRHPTFGERRVATTIRAGAVARASVDFQR